LFFLKYTLEVQ